MKHLIGVAVALAISTPAMGATEVVIPDKVLLWCDVMKESQFGVCEIKPDEHLIIMTRRSPDFDIWELCPVKDGYDPGWRTETMNEDHTLVFKCRPPLY